MNAEEARRKSIENAKKESQEIISLIQKAVDRAESHITINVSKLNENISKFLIDKGYKIEDSRLSGADCRDIRW